MWLIKVLYIHFAPTPSHSLREKKRCLFCSKCRERKTVPTMRCFTVENPPPVWVFINLSVALVCTCLSSWLTHCLSPHLNEFAHAHLIRHNLLISATLCWKLLFPHLTFLKKRAALALSSCASHNTLTGWCWSIAFKESLGSVLFFKIIIHLQSHTIPGCIQAQVFSSFFFFILFSKGFVISLEAMINLDKCDLRKALQSDASIAVIIYLKTNTIRKAECYFSTVARISSQLI